MMLKKSISFVFFMVILSLFSFANLVFANTLKLGIAQYERGEYSQAQKNLNKALKDNLNNEVAADYLARIFIAQGELEKANEALSPFFDLENLRPETLETVALYYQKNNNWLKGLEVAKKAVEVAPNSPRAHYNYGVLMFDYGLVEEAVLAFKKVMQVNPNYRDLSYYFAKCYHELGDSELEKKYYELSLQNKGVNRGALHGLAKLHQSSGRKQEAVDAYKKILEEYPDDPKANYELALLYEEVEDEKKAIKHLEVAIEDESYIEAYKALGPFIIYDKKKRSLALKVYRRLTELVPAEPDYFRQLGYLLQVTGELLAARESFEKAIMLDATHAIDYYNLGVIAQDLGDSDLAIEQLRKAIDLNAEDGDFFVSLTTVYCGLQRSSEAWNVFYQGERLLDERRRLEVLKFLQRACPIEE